MPRTPEKSNFDLDLEFGGKFETQLCNIFEGEGSVEVKADRLWSKYGNLVFEFGRYDRDTGEVICTGLLTTRARWWCSVFAQKQPHGEGHKWATEEIRIWPVLELKHRLLVLLEQGRANVTIGGDEQRTKMIRVAISALDPQALNDYKVTPDIARARRHFSEEDFSAREERMVYDLLTEDLDSYYNDRAEEEWDALGNPGPEE